MPHLRQLWLASPLALLLFLSLSVAQRSVASPSQPLPQRIVSLSPGITEMLYSLGLDKRIVADTTYCDYPPQAKTVAHIGDSFTINQERLLSLKPDLIVGDAVANRSVLPKISSLNLHIVSINVQTFEQIEQSLLYLGLITGSEIKAKYVVSQIEIKQNKAAQICGHLPYKPRVLVIAAADPLYVAGKDTFVDSMIVTCSASNIIPESGFVPYSKETAYSRNPQIIICGAGDDDTLRHDPVWATTEAGNYHHIFAIDSNLIFRPGPRLADGLLVMAKLISKSVSR